MADDLFDIEDEKEQSSLKGGDDLDSDESKRNEELRAHEKELKELLKKVQEELGMSDEDWKSEQGKQKRKEMADKVLNTANEVLKTAGSSLVSRKKANAQEKYINQFNTLIPFGYNISPKGGHCKSSGPWSNKKLSEKHKQNISNKLKGIKTWNKGIPCSDNTKRKISNSEKGKILSEHTKTKMSEASKGRPKSKEHAEKCRVANLGKKHPKIYCMHCKKYYADYMYILYHGEKCKLRK